MREGEGRMEVGESMMETSTHPVHAIATHPFPWQTVHCPGLAEHPLTSSLAQSA